MILPKIFNLRTLYSLAILALSELILLLLSLSCINGFLNSAIQDTVTLSSQKTALKLSLIEKLGRSVDRYSKLPYEIDNMLTNSGALGAAVFKFDNKKIYEKNTNIKYFSKDKIKDKIYKEDDISYTTVPFFGEKEELKGYVLTTIKLKDESSLYEIKDYLVKVFLIVLSLSLVGFLIYSAILNSRHKTLSKFKSFILPLTLAQIISITTLAIPSYSLGKAYINNLEISSGKSLCQELSRITSLGIELKNITKLDHTLTTFQSSLKNIGSLSIFDENKNLIAGNNKQFEQNSIQEIKANDRTIGYVLVLLDRISLLKIILKYAFDMFTMVLISSLIAYELSNLQESLIKKDPYEEKKLFKVELVRPLAYLGVLSLYLPISIVPLYINEISPIPLWGLPSSVYMSLPVSIDMFAIFLSSLFITFKGQKYNWKQILYVAVLLLIISMGLSFSAPNAEFFLFSRALYGLGYSSFIISLQLFVIHYATPNNKGSSFSNLISGLFAGSLCSCATGGILADMFGYRAVFLISFVLLCLYLSLIFYLSAKYEINKKTSHDLAFVKENPPRFKEISSFILQKQILGLLIFQVLPYGAIAIGMFNFFTPVILNQNGYGASAMGELNILYTLIVIILSPICGSYLDKVKVKYRPLLGGLFISSLAPLCFIIPWPLLATALAMFCLGFSSAINESGQPLLISQLKASEKIGSKNAVMVLDLFVRIGQILGPLIISLCMVAFGPKAFAFISISCMILAVFFYLSQKENKNAM